MISVIMSVYNESEQELRMSIESILNQTYREFEFIIILDNPDNDLLRNIVKEYMANYKEIIFIENKNNMGLPYSLNSALKVARGSFIARMDADDIAKEFRFEKQLQYLIENKLDLIGTSYQKIDENNCEISDGIVNDPADPSIVADLLKIRDCIGHPTWLAHRVVFEQLEGYRNIKACEDYDFLLRACKRGFKLGNLSEICLLYRVRLNSITNTHKYIQDVTAEFLRSNFQCIEEINEVEIQRFLESSAGKKQIEGAKDYNRQCDILAKYKKNKSLSCYFMQAIKIILRSSFGKNALGEKLFFLKIKLKNLLC